MKPAETQASKRLVSSSIIAPNSCAGIFKRSLGARNRLKISKFKYSGSHNEDTGSNRGIERKELNEYMYRSALFIVFKIIKICASYFLGNTLRLHYETGKVNK